MRFGSTSTGDFVKEIDQKETLNLKNFRLRRKSKIPVPEIFTAQPHPDSGKKSARGDAEHKINSTLPKCTVVYSTTSCRLFEPISGSRYGSTASYSSQYTTSIDIALFFLIRSKQMKTCRNGVMPHILGSTGFLRPRRPVFSTDSDEASISDDVSIRVC